MSLTKSPKLVLVAKTVARELRQTQTPYEQILWEALRNRRFMGKKFLRQHPILIDYDGRETFFIADFYCADSRLVVELDGKIHDKQEERDRIRTAIISDRGLTVVRFRNESVANNLQWVLAELGKRL